MEMIDLRKIKTKYKKDDILRILGMLYCDYVKLLERYTREECIKSILENNKVKVKKYSKLEQELNSFEYGIWGLKNGTNK